jgi:putative FmdB family regulatory protein
MPNYTYRCDTCEVQFSIFHSINDTLVKCQECNEEALVRVPQSIINTTSTKKQKTGTIVKDYIKDAKVDLERQKNELKNEIYKDD